MFFVSIKRSFLICLIHLSKVWLSKKPPILPDPSVKHSNVKLFLFWNVLKCKCLFQLKYWWKIYQFLCTNVHEFLSIFNDSLFCNLYKKHGFVVFQLGYYYCISIRFNTNYFMIAKFYFEFWFSLCNNNSVICSSRSIYRDLEKSVGLQCFIIKKKLEKICDMITKIQYGYMFTIRT